MKKLLYIMMSIVGAVSCDGGEIPQNQIPVAAMAIDTSLPEMKVGEVQALSVRVVPENATRVDLIWESSNPKVLTVENGTVTAKGYGRALVRAVDVINSVEAECLILVAEPERNYELVWEDEFDGATINPDNWNFETGGAGWGNQEKQYYTGRPDNARIENGHLIIEAKKENYQENSYTSARLTTKNKVFFTYGKVEARISLPPGQGTWPAFWMMPNKSAYGGWPRSGEVDIMEHVGSQPTMISHAIHTQQANGGRSWSSRGYYENAENEFHTYAVEWIDDYNNGNDAFIFYVDGVRTANVNQGNHMTSTYSDWPFDKDFYVILNLAIGGTWGGTIDDAIFSDKLVMKVDYVRMYRQK
jgi:beta-glucanase (GH16 family)